MDEDKRVFVHTEFTIASGKVDEFKKIAQELLDVVEEKESKTLRYQWYFNRDQSKCYLVEEYPNAAAVRVHILHVGLIVRKLLQVSKVTKFTLLGKLNLPRKALTAAGGQNFRYWNGLTR
ncbi:MAG: putative quinol monooxygenase [Candidatus Bathyarchaeia archaeon]